MKTTRGRQENTSYYLIGTSEYDYSLWIDGNIKVKGDINELLSHLDDCNLDLRPPTKWLDPRGCIYDEASTILHFGELNMKRNLEKIACYKDNPNLIRRQMERYLSEGYPRNNGLVVQMEVLRRHNPMM